MDSQDAGRQMLRHTVATLAYRAGKATRGAPVSFASYSTGDKGRTPAEILAHMGDLMDWALSIAKGKQQWRDFKPLPWAEAVERFHKALKALDEYLASGDPLGAPPGKIFQGAVADALTHTGQINILRRMAGCPIRGENYYRANIVVGSVGQEQAAPVSEFD
ncbi:MAG TPA: hypothetical protein VIX19_21375 [Terriglobales bacterium]